MSIVSRHESRHRRAEHAPIERQHHDPRAFAWELMVGINQRRSGKGFRPHRGQLPDVEPPTDVPPPDPGRLAHLFEKVRAIAVRSVRAVFRRPVSSAAAHAAAEDELHGDWIDPAIVREMEALRTGRPTARERQVFEDLAA